ncbi:MAG: outer membrane lipoprotein carrier protein LolA [Bacteroidota bacterium]
MRLLLIIAILFFGQFSFAQNSPVNGEDKAARELIQNVIEEYKSYESLQVNFILTTKHPNFTNIDTIRGYASGKKYRLASEKQVIVCDGDQVFFQLAESNKILSTKPDPSEVNIIYPAQMLKIYQENYYYRMAGKFPYETGKELIKLEFFPKTGLENFTKINVYVDQNSRQIIRVSKFGKDGTLNIMDLKDMLFNINLSDSLFKLEMS